MFDDTSGPPSGIESLPAREREVALIVYEAAGATARDVECRLAPPLSNGAVRSMLSRLVRKGFLRRRARRTGTRGRGQEFIYLPVVVDPEVKYRAVRRISNEEFGGSLVQMHRVLNALVEDTDRAQTG